jgi:GT2 family glycosyltransferase/glycosyltransferase involved in cell wall biosynthesis
MNLKIIIGAAILAFMRMFTGIIKRYSKFKASTFRKKRNFNYVNFETGSDSQRIAILIPTYNNWYWTKRCLESILKTPDSSLAEIWVVDDASEDETIDSIAREFPTVKVMKNERNVGFLKSCNGAFRDLRGYDWVFLLNNDTEPQPGFLIESLKVAKQNPRAALVGSKLMYPDGTLQEAGSFFWKGGNAWNFGRNSSPNLEEFNVDRMVDYCSGAALLLKLEQLLEVDFFSEEFLPAYCEDSDLAFKLRKKGYQTWYAHKSIVIHHEGKSHGTSTSSGLKKFQETNSIKFAKKWSTELQKHIVEHPQSALDAAFRLSPSLKPTQKTFYIDGVALRAPVVFTEFIKRLTSFYLDHQSQTIGEILFPHRTFIRRANFFSKSKEKKTANLSNDLKNRSLLFIEHSIPTPDTNAGDVTTFSYLQLLCRQGISVVFMPVMSFEKNRYSLALEELGVKIIRPAEGFSAWLDVNKDYVSSIWLARPAYSRMVIRIIRRKLNVKIFYYTHDLHFLRTVREAKKTRSPAKLATALRLFFLEFWIFKNVDFVLSPSQIESAIIRDRMGVATVMTLQPYFYPEEGITKRSAQSFAGKRQLVFLGGYLHSPNVDAAKFLVQEIMPLVWAEAPGTKLVIAGSSPTAEVLALEQDNVKVVGQVGDLGDLFNNSRAFIAPLRYGAGVKGKTVEAMRHGLPVVGTTIAFEGIEVENGVSALISESPKDLAQQILELIRDDNFATAVSVNGSEVIRRQFSIQSAISSLNQLFG